MNLMVLILSEIILSILLFGCNMAVNTNKSDININTDELYDIREGTLINYYGSDTTVTLPESIKSISSDAFGSDKALIKKIIIGKNVQYIDDNAFQGMCELESVSVDPENNYYVSSENYLAAKDGSTIFLFDTNSLDSQIFNFADKVGSDIFCKDGFEIVFKDAVLYFSESPDISLGTASCILDHIDAYGKTIYLETSLQGDHNINIQFFNSGLLITDYSYGIGDTFILSYDGMWEQHTFANLDENNCNDSVVNFYTNENGELIFVCMPRKYLYMARPVIYLCTVQAKMRFIQSKERWCLRMILHGMK